MFSKEYKGIADSLKYKYEIEHKELKKKYNDMFLEAVPVYPHFKVGDYIKAKELNTTTHGYSEYKIYVIKEVIAPDIFSDSFRFGRYLGDSFLEYSYGVKEILRNYAESKVTQKITPEHYSFELFIGGTKLTKSKDSFENWQPVNIEEINLVRLCQQVSEILNKLNDKRVNEQLNKYSKQSFISKKVLQDNPELLYIHENIEHLKKFQTHIKTNN